MVKKWGVWGLAAAMALAGACAPRKTGGAPPDDPQKNRQADILLPAPGSTVVIIGTTPAEDDDEDVCPQIGVILADDPRDDILTPVFADLNKTKSGAALTEFGVRNKIYGCIDEDIGRAGTDKSEEEGLYDPALNALYMNPGHRGEFFANRLTAIHELRHGFQHASGAEEHSLNIPDYKRIIHDWAVEADAAMSEIMFGWEMKKAGHPRYAAEAAAHYPVMSSLFYKAIRDNPEDPLPGMRAAVGGFFRTQYLTQFYACDVVKWMTDNAAYANDGTPLRENLTPEFFRALGEMPGYGNYMDDGLIETITNSFSDGQFQKFYWAFHDDDGKETGACRLSLPRVPVS